MGRNIEIKARIDNPEEWRSRARSLADSGPTELFQDDTFFQCLNGRLKLRAFGPGSGELIFYQRPNEGGPKESRYLIVETGTPDLLREVLTASYGQVGRVRKTRTLFLSGRTRIHLDAVETLGNFIELEVVLSDKEGAEDGTRVAKDLMTRLGIAESKLIASAYVDLLNLQQNPRATAA